jgi:hypothetical protein
MSGEFLGGCSGPHAICVTQLHPGPDRRIYEAVFA